VAADKCEVLLGRGAKGFDDELELVHVVLAWEEGPVHE